MTHPIAKIYKDYFRRRYAKIAPLTAARIEAVSASMVSMIAERKLQSLDQGPLFAAIGETHTHSAHSLIFLKTALGLKQKGFKVNVGLEVPHNLPAFVFTFLDEMWEDGEITRPSKKAIAVLKDRERDDKTKLHFVSLWMPTLQAIHAHAYIEQRLRAHGIKYAMNDAARIYGAAGRGDLDMKDPHLQEFLSGKDKESAAKKDDLPFRNQVMVKNAREHAALRDSDIYLQDCGSAHVAGTRVDPYDESIVGLFQQAQCNSMGFILNCDYAHKHLQIPVNADKSLVTTIDVRDIKEIFGFPTNEEIWLEEVKKHLTGLATGPA